MSACLPARLYLSVRVLDSLYMSVFLSNSPPLIWLFLRLFWRIFSVRLSVFLNGVIPSVQLTIDSLSVFPPVPPACLLPVQQSSSLPVFMSAVHSSSCINIWPACICLSVCTYSTFLLFLNLMTERMIPMVLLVGLVLSGPQGIDKKYLFSVSVVFM